MHRQYRWLLSAAFALVATMAAAARGESETGKEPDFNTLEAMLGRIHQHAASDEWRKEGFTDKILEAWLDKLVARLSAATEDKDLKLPVRFADVTPSGDGEARISKGLLITKGGEVSASDSIILCDGSIRVGSADRCLIIARGTVYVAHGQSSVVLAGAYVHMSHCNSAGRIAAGAPPLPRSIIFSRGIANVAHAHRAVMYAPTEIEVSHADGCIFINHPVPDARGVRDRVANKRIDMKPAPLEPLLKHSLSTEVEFLGVTDDSKGAIIRYGGKRYVAEKDLEIADESGKPVEKLAGWKLSFVHDRFLLLSKGEIDAGVVRKGR